MKNHIIRLFRSLVRYLTSPKAVTALLAPIAVAAVAHFGFSVDVNTASVVIISVLTSLGVYQAPYNPVMGSPGEPLAPSHPSFK